MASWRDATAADVGEVVRLVRGLAEYEKLLHEFVATEADYRAALEAGAIRAMLAEEAGRAVAVCVYYGTFSTFAGKAGLWIEDIFVEPEHRRRGLARAAFAEVARRALDEGCAWVEWNVLDWNAPAIAAYRAMGAEPREGWQDMRVSGDALKTLAGRSR
ncbi:MAG: GNAT family N-acetyltransferase [Acetobacteraceae bacterium]|nr:GNAT family N-acetyltransferase [Acetobacteraceae bacterium]